MARAKKTKEQKIREIDEKIAFHQERIAALEKKKEEINAPTLPQLISMAKKKGMSSLEIMAALGLDEDE